MFIFVHVEQSYNKKWKGLFLKNKKESVDKTDSRIYIYNVEHKLTKTNKRGV